MNPKAINHALKTLDKIREQIARAEERLKLSDDGPDQEIYNALMDVHVISWGADKKLQQALARQTETK